MAPVPIRISSIFFCSVLLILIALSKAYDHDGPLRSEEVDDVPGLLTKYGFPKGLVPDNVKSCLLTHDGLLRLQLQNPCTVSSLGIRYNVKVRARLAYGSLTRVYGIRGKTEYGFWLTVDSIKINETSSNIGFSIGGRFKDFPAKDFDVAPACEATVFELEAM